VIGDIVADVLEGKPNKWKHNFAWRTIDHSSKRAIDVARKPGENATVPSSNL
jgi:hypothetical protein